ncbi:MAG TPA: CPBP family intramembrane glutamic endopeptidase [Sphingobacteriaceae bacterium]|nr:CPBP family intramembrane glutamic endopeptidase [Sphingobacteriaceae bacterium]
MRLVQTSKAPHPVSSLLLLLVLMIVGSLVGTLLAMVIAVITSGMTDLSSIMLAMESPANDLNFFRIVQGGSSIGMCVIPALVLGMVEKRLHEYAPLTTSNLQIRHFILVFVLVLTSGAVIEWLGKLNSHLTLPERLSGLERWMYNQEMQLEEITITILSDISVGGFLANLLVIAVIPAIGEELLFRGALQSIFLRWFRNPHVAIWVAAIIFSVIHLQFYGFLPRLALGALFGYLFFWSKNLWLPIFAHFVNNAGILLVTFILQRRGNSLDSMDYMDDISIPVYLISFAITAGLLWMLWRQLGSGHKKGIGPI